MKNASAFGLGFVGVIILFLALVALGAVLTMLFWNWAVVGIVAACGGHVGHIGFWLALGLNILWGIIGGLIRGN